MLNKVYVIDDDEISLYLAQTVFELYAPQTECVCFDNAIQALRRLEEDVLEETLPNLILLDLNMPVMSGLGFLKAVRPMAAALENKCFICVLTSSVNEQDRLQCLASGLVLDLIQKPFVEEKLMLVSKLLVRLNLSLT
ncbi:response regulator [Pontibacter brevis]